MLLMVSAKPGQRWSPRPQTANRPLMTATPATDGQPAANDGHPGQRWPPWPQTANRLPMLATPATDGQLPPMTATPAADDGHSGCR